jgi:hypothetical protein
MGNTDIMRHMPFAVFCHDVVGGGARCCDEEGMRLGSIARACRPLRLFLDVHLYAMPLPGGVLSLCGGRFGAEPVDGGVSSSLAKVAVGLKRACVGLQLGNALATL